MIDILFETIANVVLFITSAISVTIILVYLIIILWILYVIIRPGISKLLKHITRKKEIYSNISEIDWDNVDNNKLRNTIDYLRSYPIEETGKDDERK